MFKIFTKKNLEILNLLFKEETYLRDIATKLRISPGKVHSSINLFKKYQLVNVIKLKNKKIIKINENSILLKKIKSLLNVYKLINSKNFKKLKKFGKIGVYGSFSNGGDDKNSDVDLWLLTDKKYNTFADILRNLEKELDKKINLLLLNSKKIKNLREKDYEFYLRLKITSIGDDVFD